MSIKSSEILHYYITLHYYQNQRFRPRHYVMKVFAKFVKLRHRYVIRSVCSQPYVSHMKNNYYHPMEIIVNCILYIQIISLFSHMPNSTQPVTSQGKTTPAWAGFLQPGLAPPNPSFMPFFPQSGTRVGGWRLGTRHYLGRGGALCWRELK